jgi:hypothetical protein
MPTALVIATFGALGFVGAGRWAPDGPRGASRPDRSRNAPPHSLLVPLFALDGLYFAFSLLP